MTIEEKITEIAAPLCRDEGLYLMEVNIRGDAKNRLFEIIADNEKGITLGQCQRISRQIQDELDMDERFQQNYRLNVSSPGLERPLIYDWQFKKNIGKTLKLVLDDGEKISATLLDINEDELEVATGEGKAARNIKRSAVKKAKVKLQW